MIQRATVPGKWPRPNHVGYIPKPTGSVLSTQEILDPSVHYPVLDHHLESSPLPNGEDWYVKNDTKSYCTRKIAASRSRTVHFKTHRVCPIHKINIGPIGPLSSTWLSPWIEPSSQRGGQICQEWYKELLYQENSCVTITYDNLRPTWVCTIQTRT